MHLYLCIMYNKNLFFLQILKLHIIKNTLKYIHPLKIDQIETKLFQEIQYNMELTLTLN